MRVLVLGAGGIGGYYGGRLAQAGEDVTFLVREKRRDILRANGLVIESPLGDATVAATTVVAGKVGDDYDLVLLSCKAYDLDSAMDAIAPAVGSGTIVLPLLNGIAHLDALDDRFGADRVIGGLAHISVTLAANGAVRHLNKLHLLTFGPRSQDQRPRCEAIEAMVAAADFDARLSDDVMRDMWEKFAFITAAAGITCLMRASVGAIMDTLDGHRLTLALLGECDAVASAAGFPVSAKAKGWAEPFLTKTGSDFTASMLRDLETGSRVEADHLQGDMIQRGEALGIETELLRVAFCALQAYGNRRRAG